VNWTQQGSSTTITMASTVYAGLAVTSHDTSMACIAAFDNVTIPGWTNWTVPPVPGDWENVVSPAPQIVSNQWQVVLPLSATNSSTFYRLVN